MTRRALSGLVFFAAAMTTNALAQDLPRYDVQRYCEYGGAMARMTTTNGCISLEQMDYDNLKRKW